jgi:hypothetical protein
MGRPFPSTAHKCHKKWFSRDVSNTKVVSVCVINKKPYIMCIFKDVRGNWQDVSSFWQAESGIRNASGGMSSTQKLLHFGGPAMWFPIYMSSRTFSDICGTPFFFKTLKCHKSNTWRGVLKTIVVLVCELYQMLNIFLKYMFIWLTIPHANKPLQAIN